MYVHIFKKTHGFTIIGTLYGYFVIIDYNAMGKMNS